METFPIEGDVLPYGIDAEGKQFQYAGWLLFLDECNSASREVQAACYKLILDRMVGIKNLHSKVAIVAAGNLDTDGAIVEQTSTAMQSRMAHLFTQVDKDEWIKWASGEQFDHRILSFIEFKPGLLYTFKPDHSDATYASPRTWEFANRIIKRVDVKERKALPMMSGCIGEGVAREFLSYCDIVDKLPTIADIITAPEQVRVSGEPSILFAISGSLAHHANKENVNELFKYIMRMPVEFQMICMRMMILRTPSIMAQPVMQQWVAKYAKELF